MAIIEHLVDQSAGKLDNIKMNKHKKSREKVMEGKDVPTRLDESKHSSPSVDPHNCPGSVVYSEGASIASSHGAKDENLEVASVVAPDGFVYPHSAIYSGMSSPFVNVPSYVPYSIDGVYYYSPVIDYRLLNQHLYGLFSLDPQYSAPGYGYGTQMYQYSPHGFYQHVPTGDYFPTPLGVPAGGAVMLNPQDSSQVGVVMPSELNNVSGYALPLPALPENTAPAHIPGKGGSAVDAASYAASHVLRASAPAWVETPFKQKGLGVQPGGSGTSIPLSTVKAVASAAPSVIDSVAPAAASPGASANVMTMTTISHTAAEAPVNTIPPSGSAVDPSFGLDGAIKQDQEGKVASLVNTSVKVPTDSWVSKVRGSNGYFGAVDKILGPCLPNGEAYNSINFEIKYDYAKFFIIKSYSEDNVYRSIEYSVWASTPNGNKKLDEAYKDACRQAIGKKSNCPVFLFFSVNGSRQFCGVAEMTGHLDYNKTMAFWEQHKWSGSFPVKWHIIKNVPNSQFRKIILENNENKPVTNSRDTQEVNFQQGLEMLSIFKNYPTRTSILDEFCMIATQKGMHDLQLQHWSEIGELPTDGDEAQTAKLSSPVPKPRDLKPTVIAGQEERDSKMEAKNP